MAHKKAAGTTKNGRDSNPKYLGIKVSPGEKVTEGSILVRQRGSRILAGANIGTGSDYTLFALRDGIVEMKSKRATRYDGKQTRKPIVSIR